MRARFLLVVLLVGLALALLASSWSGRARVLRAGDLLTVGQGEALVEAARRRLAGVPPEEMQARLAEMLDDERPAGLRFVGLTSVDALVHVAAGEPSGPWPRAAVVGRPSLERFGTRVRMTSGGPPPRGARRGATQEPWFRPRQPDPEGRTPWQLRSRRPLARGPGERPLRGRGQLVVEFEPLVARDLEREATRTLVVGALTSLALVASALFLWRLLVRQEHGERLQAEQRRLAVLGEMSAVLAHEIRNPLASLKGHAQLLAEGLEEGTPHRRGADRVVGEAKRLERLASSLLDFVRTSQVEPETADPAALARECALEAGAGRVDVDAAGAPPAWRLDVLRIRQVLRNLIENALQASPPESRVSLRVALEAAERGRGERLVFEVRDKGHGLPPGGAERLFEPFHTTRTTGTGLGLAVARRIVELHAGRITAANDPQGGAVFRVELSRMPES